MGNFQLQITILRKHEELKNSRATIQEYNKRPVEMSECIVSVLN